MAETMVQLIQEGKDISITLTDTERERFEVCEQVIKKGLGTFLEVGGALAEIRDKKLWREKYPTYTFERYCKVEWDLGKSRAYQKIDGYRVVELLESKKSTIVDEIQYIPINEAQARPFARLLKNPDDVFKARDLIQQKLTENPKAKLTSSLIGKAVKEVSGEVVKKKIKDTKKKIDGTSLLSKQFKYAHQTLLDVISEERNSGWKTSSKKEAVKWLTALIKIAQSED